MIANTSDDYMQIDDNPLRKRVFRYTLNNNNYNGPNPPNEGDLNGYLTAITHSNNGGDTYFGPLLPLFYGKGD
jgi:hypothetical protein